jgi:hypothetical protein
VEVEVDVLEAVGVLVDLKRRLLFLFLLEQLTQLR